MIVIPAIFLSVLLHGESGYQYDAFANLLIGPECISCDTADAAKTVKIPSGHLNSDLHGSAEYRAHLVSVLAGRAVAAMGA